MNIQTPDDWWNALDQHWPNLLECFFNCGTPLDGYSWSEGIDKEVTIHEKKLLTVLEEAKRDHAHEVMQQLGTNASHLQSHPG